MKKQRTGTSVSWKTSVEVVEKPKDKTTTQNNSYCFTNCTFNFYGPGVCKEGIDGAISKVAKNMQGNEENVNNVMKTNVKPAEAITFDEIPDSEMIKVVDEVFTFKTPDSKRNVPNPYLKKVA